MMDPSTITKSTRRALARGIHLQYEDDEPPSELPPTLRAWRENVIVPTGRPSASLPYLHGEEVARVCICVDEHFGAARPWPSSWRPRRTTACCGKNRVWSSHSPFAGDALAPAAVGHARRMRIELVDAGHEALLPVQRTTRLRLCPGAADKSALFDAVLRIAMEPETSEPARRAPCDRDARRRARAPAVGGQLPHARR